MRERSFKNLIQSIAWFLWALAVAFALRQAWNLGEFPPQAIPARLVLAGTAAICLRLSARGVPSFYVAPLIALLVLEPDAWSLVLGLVVIATARRWRTARERRHPLHLVSSASVAWTLAYAFVASGALAPLQPPGLRTAVLVVVAWAVLRGISWGLLNVLEHGDRARAHAPAPAELLNPALAWLFVLLVSGAGAIALLGLPLTVGAQVLSTRLYEIRRDLRRAHEALDSRTAEIRTLHTVGKELLARPDDSRLGPLLDRECRKLFDPEGFTLWLADNGPLRQVYRREGERIDARKSDADSAVARWLREEKRGVCWRAGTGTLQLRPRLARTRSAIIAPLLVEQRVAGAVAVESGRADRFDEHHLAVLTTLAQQAAAALESHQHQKRATIDSLTGFFLREYFFRRLEEEQLRTRRYGGHFALLMIDVDSFKPINDRHGHLAGDHYMRAVAETIRGRLRSADMPCRYGGDEFALLLPETDLQGACTIAERIRVAVAELEVRAEGAALASTVSIGVAVFPEHGTSETHGLLRRADEALYRAKRAGRDRVVPYAA